MRSDHIETLCAAIVEMMNAAPHDLCGEHRTFYGKRLGDAFEATSHLFPVQMARALSPSLQAPRPLSGDGAGGAVER